MRAHRLSWLCAPTLILAGCVVGPNYQRPPLSPQAAILAPGDKALTPSASPRLISGGDLPADWWTLFGSPKLNALVAQGLKNSPTLDAAKAALRSAKELVRAQRGAYYPTVEASIQPTRQKFARDLASPAASGNSLYTLTTSQVTVSYTPDLFGANKRTVENLSAQADAQGFELEAARLTLASNLVSAAIQDALLRDQIDATEEIIADQRATLSSFQRQFELGQASRADLAAQETLLAQTEATLPPLEKLFQTNRDLIAALLGRTPGEGLEVSFTMSDFALPPTLPLSLPARLVEQRPDVRIAEAQLRAASAQVGIAEAARWPNLTLSAAGGSAPTSLGISAGGAATFWSLAANLVQPIFEGGQLLHKARAARAAYDQAAAQYRATVIGAFQNTADVLHALAADAKAEDAAARADIAASQSLKIADRRLALGDVSRLSLLAAEQARDQTKINRLTARASYLSDGAALFQALGGGWWNRPVDGAAHGGGF